MKVIATLKDASDLLKSVAALGWMAVAAFVAVGFRSIISDRRRDLSKFSAGPTGFTLEFVSEKLDKAAERSPGTTADSTDKSVLASRLEAHASLLRDAHVLWVDDHPEHNTAIVDLLTKFHVDVEVATSNAAALATLAKHPRRFNVLISDVGRDKEPEAGSFPGVELATRALEANGVRTIFFAGPFRPTSAPGLSADERIELAEKVERVAFGRTNRADELVHLVLDALERTTARH